MKRVLAWAGLLAFAAAVLALIVLTVTGASANKILVVLFCLLVLPVLFYGLSIYAKMQKDSQETEKEEKTREP